MRDDKIEKVYSFDLKQMYFLTLTRILKSDKNEIISNRIWQF